MIAAPEARSQAALHSAVQLLGSGYSGACRRPIGHQLERAALWLEEARAAGVPTDGDSLLIGDTLITVCPWWDPVGRDAVAAHVARDDARRPAKWVWVYHWPPLGSPTCWTGRRQYGDEDLGGWIAEHRPDVVLTGHVHDPPFKPMARGPTASAIRGSSRRSTDRSDTDSRGTRGR